MLELISVCIVSLGTYFFIIYYLLCFWKPKIFLILNILKLIPISINENILNFFFNNINSYFNHKIIFEENYQKPSIKCLSPHGVIPFAFFKMFEYYKSFYVVTHRLFDLPIINNLKFIIPADFNKMKESLENNSILLYPGGFREVFYSDHRKDKISIKKRKGIFRLALETKKPLIPIYTFGITELYEKSDVKMTIPYLFKNKKDSVSFYYGKYYSLIPLKKDLLTVVGKRIDIRENDTIKSLRGRYIRSVKDIFRRYSKRELKIL